MSAEVDLYDAAHANYGSDVYRQVRMESYREKLDKQVGSLSSRPTRRQLSFSARYSAYPPGTTVTSKECWEIPQLLDLKPNSLVLDIYPCKQDLWPQQGKFRVEPEGGTLPSLGREQKAII